MKIKLISLILLLLLLAGLYFSCFIVREGEYAIITRFGNPVKIIKKAGLYVKRPGFLEDINYFDKRINVFTTQPIQLLLSDQNPIILTLYVGWKIARPLLFFESLTNKQNSEQKLGDLINSQLGNVLGKYTIGNIINVQEEKVKLPEIEKNILENSNLKIKDKYGIEIVDVGITRIAYPSIVTNAVYDRMRSERQKEASKYRAEGREEGAKIQAKTDKEVSEILSTAYKEAEIIKGEGDKESMKIYSGVYSKDPEFFQFLKSLEAYEQILGEKTTLILSTASDFFKYFILDKQEKTE